MKQALHKLAAEWDESLHLAGNAYWNIEGITDVEAFFQHLPVIFPHGMTLLIEGLEICLTARSFYEEHPARYTKKVACDGLSPAPAFYHVEFSEKLSEGLGQIIKSRGLEEAFYHFKGYSEHEILFTFHDAFEGPLVVSRSIDEAAVTEFAKALGKTVEAASFPHDPREHLMAMDQIFNPPLWRRVWMRLFGKEMKVEGGAKIKKL